MITSMQHLFTFYYTHPLYQVLEIRVSSKLMYRRNEIHTSLKYTLPGNMCVTQIREPQKLMNYLKGFYDI